MHCHREDKYVQKIMSTHGLREEMATFDPWRRDRNGQWGKFQYTEPIANHVTTKSKH